jgi:O-antigen/teichoic acid export membrane protein
MTTVANAGPVPAPTDQDDLAELARGGRTNVFGFVLRLAARLPFLFIAGRWYGAEALGRFAYAIIIVEFAAQLATFGLRRGLAQQLVKTDRPHVHVVWDALLIGGMASAVAAVLLGLLPGLMFPNSTINGLEWLLPLTIFALTWSDISLAALAYRHDIAATVKARAVVEPWTISIAAFALSWYSLRDGLIIAYVLSMIAALTASIVPLMRSYGWPRGWRPRSRELRDLARRNAPLAAADAVEWGSRRIDIAILGLVFSPAIVGIYYVAQQVASLPQKLKTSFDPILGPVITQKLQTDDKQAVAKQVRQVGFWIIAAQTGVGLALGIPGEAVMGLVGPNFVGGTGALAFLLAAEVVAATAVVSEAALIYVARFRNLMISLGMIVVQIALSFGLIELLKDVRPFFPRYMADAAGHAIPLDRSTFVAAAPAMALTISLALASIVKSRLLARLLSARVSGWRWPLVWAAAVAGAVGFGVTHLPPSLEWLELTLGIVAILASYSAVIWYKGFGREDRALFRMKTPPTPPITNEV